MTGNKSFGDQNDKATCSGVDISSPLRERGLDQMSS